MNCKNNPFRTIIEFAYLGRPKRYFAIWLFVSGSEIITCWIFFTPPGGIYAIVPCLLGVDVGDALPDRGYPWCVMLGTKTWRTKGRKFGPSIPLRYLTAFWLQTMTCSCVQCPWNIPDQTKPVHLHSRVPPYVRWWCQHSVPLYSTTQLSPICSVKQETWLVIKRTFIPGVPPYPGESLSWLAWGDRRDGESGWSSHWKGSWGIWPVCCNAKLLKSRSKIAYCRSVDVGAPTRILVGILPLSMPVANSCSSCCSCGILQIAI